MTLPVFLTNVVLLLYYTQSKQHWMLGRMQVTTPSAKHTASKAGGACASTIPRYLANGAYARALVTWIAKRSSLREEKA
jgi:hypothetical protein